MASIRCARPVFIALAAFLLLLRDAAARIDLCAKADNKALCGKVVKHEHNAAAAVEKAIRTTLIQLKNAKAAARNGQSGSTCAQVYDDAIDSLTTSLENLKNKDVSSLNSNLSAVMSDVSSCEDGMKESAKDKNPGLNRLNSRVRDLANNNLFLASEIAN